MPVASRELPGTEAQPWVVPLPGARFKVGMNELRIETRQRSQPGVCRDLDNAANWVTLSGASRLYLTRRLALPYRLSSYPFPYVDPLAEQPVQATFVLPQNYSDADLAVLLTLASDWGRRHPTVPLAPIVRTGESPITTPHEVLINSTGATTGRLAITTEATNAQLTVTGSPSEGLLHATAALCTPTFTRNAFTTQETVTRAMALPTPTPGIKYGLSSLSTLGVDDVTLTGAFTRTAMITLARPVQADLGKATYLDLHFRHAAALASAKSQLSVAMNGRPVGSVRLTAANANAGTLRLQLPLASLIEPVWVFTFTAYHDLANAECDKWHEGVAWTVIDAEQSTLGLAKGRLPGGPYLEQFAAVRRHDGRPVQPVSLWLPDQPTDAQLTLAATVAMRAGQANLATLRWQVLHGDPGAAKPHGAIFVIGTSRAVVQQQSLAQTGRISVAPKNAATFLTKLPLPDSALTTTAILQASPNPWDARGVLYALYSPSARMDDALSRLLADPTRRAELRGEVSLLYPDGTVESVPTREPAELHRLIERERGRYTPLMWAIVGILVLLVAAAITWLVRVIRRKPAPLMPMADSVEVE